MRNPFRRGPPGSPSLSSTTPSSERRSETSAARPGEPLPELSRTYSRRGDLLVIRLHSRDGAVHEYDEPTSASLGEVAVRPTYAPPAEHDGDHREWLAWSPAEEIDAERFWSAVESDGASVAEVRLRRLVG